MKRSTRVGSGIGPTTCAPVPRAVSMMPPTAWSSTRWSYAWRRMRTLCCCIVFSFFLSVSTRARTFLLAFVPSFLCLDGRDFRARLTDRSVSRRRRVRPVGRLARDWVPAQQSPQKQGSRPLFATASLKLNGHDATGYTRPYRDPSLARIVYSISKTLRYAQGGILAFLSLCAPSDLCKELAN